MAEGNVKTPGRKDGRGNAQVRALACELGLLNRADGSARFSMGETSALVAVYGPADIRDAKAQTDRATVEVVVRTKTGLPGPAERAMEATIRQVLEGVILTTLYPHTSITVVVQVMRNGGSFLSCALNGACLALCDAGVPLDGMLAASTVALNPKIALDPLLEEEQTAAAVMTFAFKNSNLDAVLLSQAEGVFEEDQYFKCLQAAAKTVTAIISFMRLSIERKLSKEHNLAA
eukprot:comp11505_c1_seq1/m.5954 comp11505_c1_seq1/g.5954  ORF comp11505_c1_seq1/g.5954 comp11505_c1_seq1/m.5954 type:complete len:232 (-) comp11505_c1_seq1:489-1184(-)